MKNKSILLFLSVLSIYNINNIYGSDIKIICSKWLYSKSECTKRCNKTILVGSSGYLNDSYHTKWDISSYTGVYSALDHYYCVNYMSKLDNDYYDLRNLGTRCNMLQRASRLCKNDCLSNPVPCVEYKIDVKQMIESLPTNALSKYYDPNIVYQ